MLLLVSLPPPLHSLKMRRDLSHKTAPLLVQLTAARPFHLIGYSVWPRVRLPVALFTFWAGVVYTLHSFGHLPNVGSTGSLTAILSMGELRS